MTVKPVEGATAERFCEFYPKRVEKAIDMLAQGKTVNQICKTVRARYTTIKALKYRKIKEIAERKKALAELSFESAMETMERAMQNIDKCSPYQLTGMHGIFRETFNSVTNDPVIPAPQLHLHVDVVAQFMKLLDAANNAAKQIKGTEVKQIQNGQDSESC